MADLTLMDEVFLADWKSRDFSKYNESDIREDFVAKLLDTLGYRKGTIFDIIREKSLRLAEPYHRIGRKRVDIDYVPTVRLRGFWIIEAKAGDPREMTFGDLLQVHFYAIHPEVRASLVVLTNGWSIRVYDAAGFTGWENVLLWVDQNNCDQLFSELKELLGARSMLLALRKRTLQVLHDTFAVEADVRTIRSFRSEIEAMLSDAERVVDANAKKLEVEAFQRSEKDETDYLAKATTEELLVLLDIPTQPFPRRNHALVERIRASSFEDQRSIVDKLSMTYRGRPHAVFRVHCVSIFADLIQLGIQVPPSIYIKSMTGSLEELVTYNFDYWSFNELAEALCHLDNTSLRVAKKFALAFAVEPAKSIVQSLQDQLHAEDFIGQRISVGGFVITTMGLLGEALWRDFSSSASAAEIWDGIWILEDLEAELERLPSNSLPRGEYDFLFFDHYGKRFDMLIMGTWDVLQSRIANLPQRDISPKVIERASLNRDGAMRTIPAPRIRPVGYEVPLARYRAKLSVRFLSAFKKEELKTRG